MATPLSAAALLAALRAEGVRAVERSGWRTHHRNHKGPWGGVNGVAIHHTAGASSLNFVWSGMASLPGPLCHTHLAKNGTATMISAGRANHFGTMARNAYDAMVDESPNHPRPDAAEPIDGNRHLYGIEIENLGDGRDPYPAVQYDQAVRWAAAICRAHGWTEHSVIGHGEGTRRKIDPSFDMNTFRADVAARLRHPADWNPEEDDDMALSKEDVERIAQRVWEKDHFINVPWGTETNGQWMAKSILVDTGARLRALQAAVTELAARGAARDAVLARLAEGGGLSAADAQRAAEAGATAALDRLAIALAADVEG
ncbi:N-acetylmuramoyl-L-alanine amidase [Streptomyces sp. E11-3]|uniref:peptidoglycan recognition protein family protein n=1 Tax=Streptomyces sp. E11-3 TaxID=3110112 RepID=UPI00397EE42E